MTVVVIGGGLAGAVACLELAARDVSVVMVRASAGASALGGGTFDVAAASPRWRPVRRHDGSLTTPRDRLASLLERAPRHPYHRVLAGGELGKSAIEGAQARLNETLASERLAIEGDLDRNQWLFDVRGALRVTDFAVNTVARGDLRRDEPVGELLLPTLAGLEGWDAAAVARRLSAELHALGEPSLPVHLGGAELPPPLPAGRGTPAQWARRFESPETLAALAAALRGSTRSGRLLLLPPVLGIDRHAYVLDELARQLEGPVAELVGVAPLHLMGTRIDRALQRGLERAGVEVVDGRAVDGEASQGALCRVRLEARPGRPEFLEARAVVLASGRFLAGGLRDGAQGLREVVFGLPLFDAAGRRIDGTPAAELTTAEYDAEQALYQAGVATDSLLRPLGPDGMPAYSNLFVAGDLLGGFDPARDRTGYGVAMSSGYRVALNVLDAMHASATSGRRS